MARGPRGGLIRSIQGLFDAGAIAALDDEALLSRFLARDDGSPAAFEAIVARHGAMVYDVCRTVTRSDSDADDAFQAVFLILACRAAGVRRRGELGPWLFGVARRTALRARRDASRRREREAKAAALATTTSDPPRDDDAVAILIEEVDRLPSRYRGPVVLCHLQGLSYEAAAGRLGCPTSTLGVRLKRGRERLRSRLERRGVDAPTILPPGTAVPEVLAAATSRLASLVAPSLRDGVPASVLTLTRGALRTMRMSRIVVASTAFLALAAGAWAWSLDDADPAPPRSARLKPAPPRFPDTYRVTGRVTDPRTGEPIAGATVYVLDCAEGIQYLDTVTGSDGAYALGLPPGHAGGPYVRPAPGCWVADSWDPMASFTLSADEPVWRRDIAVARGAPWEFRLTWAHGGKPAGGARIRGGALEADADAAGVAVLGLPRDGGEAGIAVESPGERGWAGRKLLSTIRWDDGFDPESAVDLVRMGAGPADYRLIDRRGNVARFSGDESGGLTPRIEEGRVVIDVALPEPPTAVLPPVIGEVLDVAGRPVSGASVQVSWEWREPGGSSGGTIMSSLCRGRTDAMGRYRLADVPATVDGRRIEAVRVDIARSGFAPSGAGPVGIPADGPVQMPCSVLRPGGAVVGTLVDANGRPIVGAMVGEESPTRAATRTDAKGRFRLGDLPEGPTSVRIRYGPLHVYEDVGDATVSGEPRPVVIRLAPRP